jgi:hypothetical protein
MLDRRQIQFVVVTSAKGLRIETQDPGRMRPAVDEGKARRPAHASRLLDRRGDALCVGKSRARAWCNGGGPI